MNVIQYQGRDFNDGDMEDSLFVLEDSIPADELAIDQMEVTLKCPDMLPVLLSATDSDTLETTDGYRLTATRGALDLSRYRYGDPIVVLRQGRPYAKFYASNAKWTGGQLYRVTGISAMGLLESDDLHYGGVYNGITAAELIADIIGSVVEYSVEPEIAGTRLYGWLPIATRRGNLQQVLFAIGARVRKGENGRLVFGTFSLGGPAHIDDGRLELEGGVDYQDIATGVRVVEHTYSALSTVDAVALYNGAVVSAAITTPKGVQTLGTIVKFKAAHFALETSGTEIIESGVNYAVLAPCTDCALMGKPYTESQRIVEVGRVADEARDIQRVENATLVSPFNVENVAKRVFAYYGSTRLISTRMVVGAELPGDPVTLNDPFGARMAGFIKSMEFGLSKELLADTVFASGYIPTGTGNKYNHLVVVTQSGAVNVPDGAGETLKLVLISGGTGGGNGERGGSHDDVRLGPGGMPFNFGGIAAKKGGKGGAGGSGGRVLEIEVPTAVLNGSIEVQIGIGGSEYGAVGGDTTAGGYTSASGEVRPNGYVDVMSGVIYAAPGGRGVDGGDGGAPGEAGQAVGDFPGGVAYGGRAGTLRYDVAHLQNVYYLCYYQQGGAGGGGATATGRGNDVSPRTPEISLSGAVAPIIFGGKGGDAGPRDVATIPGCGGDGGHGGGGCGAAIALKLEDGDGTRTPTVSQYNYFLLGGRPGAPGPGAPGALLIYY